MVRSRLVEQVPSVRTQFPLRCSELVDGRVCGLTSTSSARVPDQSVSMRSAVLSWIGRWHGIAARATGES